MLEYKVNRKAKKVYMKRSLTNVLLFHKDSEILKLLFNNIDYYKNVSRIIYSECKDYQDELVEKRNKIKKEIKKTSCDRFHNFVCLKHACEHAYA